ncbi:hypothetical protein P6F26_06225 [Roseibacterium sp. SDUM158017]|uniref:hypothetical protein n=1 Tax=Roseicyclus salinarum TaxID=3036773 RepID=UPI002414DD1E|nr:hypothetical protein [Roseibacterium sp. SDUM158017]MDG4648033.1 hypothetical protein [Roseibacterium sp. SDUM158017]
MTDSKHRHEHDDHEEQRREDRPEQRPEGAHTEVRPSPKGEDRKGPQPRSKRLPDELRDDPTEDDPFNDVPV